MPAATAAATANTAAALTDARVAAFHERGFVLGPRLLDDATIATLRDEVERVIADRDRADVAQPVLCRNLSGDDDNFVWQIVNIWQASDAFRRLLFDFGLGAMAARLMGAREVRLWHDQVQHKPPRKGGTNWWHQDSIYWPPIQPKDQQVTAWIALDDADPDNGCMSMTPGSHRWGDRMNLLHTLQKEHGNAGFLTCLPPALDGHDVAVVHAPVPAGAVHLHHALTWHGSQANTSGRPRRAIAIHMATEQTVLDPAQGNHPMTRFATDPGPAPLAGDAFPLLHRA